MCLIFKLALLPKVATISLTPNMNIGENLEQKWLDDCDLLVIVVVVVVPVDVVVIVLVGVVGDHPNHVVGCSTGEYIFQQYFSL